MHQILLITAMTATSGLFGGGRHCGAPRHFGRQAVGCQVSSYSHAPAYAPSCAPCGGYAAPAYGHGYGYPAPAPQAAPAPAPAPQAAPPAPAKQAPAPQAAYAPPTPQIAYYPSYYYPAATYACPTGNCPRR